MQEPEQVPAPVQTNAQLLLVTQEPLSSHFCETVPEHCIVPGVQLPVQIPAPEQTYGHAEVVCQVPEASHFLALRASHFVV